MGESLSDDRSCQSVKVADAYPASCGFLLAVLNGAKFTDAGVAEIEHAV